MKHGSEARMQVVKINPLIVRITHWLNAIAIFVMVGSGWAIYNNVPIIPWLHFPGWALIQGDPDITFKLNGDGGFSNALLWHFAAMWLFVLNGLVYVGYGLASGRFRRKLLPFSAREFIADVVNALKLKLSHDDISHYNAIQKLLYLGILCVLVLIVVSGLAIWKPVQLQEITAFFGGFQGARLVHFLCMTAIVLFIVVHVALALLVPSTLVAMVTGKARLPAQATSASTSASASAPMASATE